MKVPIILFFIIWVSGERLGPNSNSDPICYDDSNLPIFDASKREECVFSVEAQVILTVGKVPEVPNPNCKHSNICFGGCYAGSCLKLGFARFLLETQTQNCLNFLFGAVMLVGIGMGVFMVVVFNDRQKFESLSILKEGIKHRDSEMSVSGSSQDQDNKSEREGSRRILVNSMLSLNGPRTLSRQLSS